MGNVSSECLQIKISPDHYHGSAFLDMPVVIYDPSHFAFNFVLHRFLLFMDYQVFEAQLLIQSGICLLQGLVCDYEI